MRERVCVCVCMRVALLQHIYIDASTVNENTLVCISKRKSEDQDNIVEKMHNQNVCRKCKCKGSAILFSERFFPADVSININDLILVFISYSIACQRQRS